MHQPSGAQDQRQANLPAGSWAQHTAGQYPSSLASRPWPSGHSASEPSAGAAGVAIRCTGTSSPRVADKADAQLCVAQGDREVALP